MIDIKQLTENDKGRWVRYISPAGYNTYIGRIKSWDSEFIYVVIKLPDREMDFYKDYMTVPIEPERLEFMDYL